MVTALWVALGGAAGSVGRYLITGGLNGRSHPWGTVVVNVVGSFALGILVGKWGFSLTSPQRLGVSIGLLGGFTTFSTFSLDTIYLWENGETSLAIASVLVSVLLGIAAATVGLAIGRS